MDLIKKNEFYAKLFNKFDTSLSKTLEQFRKQINVSITKVENRLDQCEKTLKVYMDKQKQAYNNDLNLAEILINKELRSKVIMSQWTNKFLSSSKDETLDPITFALCRFSLNICLCYHEVKPNYLLNINIHKQLISYITILPSELVIGSSLMALVHISLYSELKSPIVISNVLPILLKIIIKHNNKIILAQCMKLCASLALEYSNKIAMSQSGCLHAMFDLILGTNHDVNHHIQYFAICAIVNTIYKNDTNRILSVELNGIKPLLTIMKTSSYENIIIESINALANISYSNSYTSNQILLLGGGEVLVEILETCDILRQPLIVQAILSTFSNICSSDVNQSHIGSIRGLVEVTIRICEHARLVLWFYHHYHLDHHHNHHYHYYLDHHHNHHHHPYPHHLPLYTNINR